MYTLFTIIHVLACIIMILVVLLQAGKGANMGAAFGGSSQTVFGSSGAGTFLGKMTATVAIVFMITSLALTYSVSRKGSSLFERSAAPITKQAVPAAPAQNAAIPAPAPPAPVNK
ncbi:MAG: preprotein translocase subunit SecG [Deltaproteobacteria bacterium HGW-Deltaproteobacteria-12]|jgi:preprotein translocase subunit SecG|nr:MAG: preprotein translocase subunit SecG [Deltaproteobacteria bacterium HGW-Deltaproteobacteria-12]